MIIYLAISAVQNITFSFGSQQSMPQDMFQFILNSKAIGVPVHAKYNLIFRETSVRWASYKACTVRQSPLYRWNGLWYVWEIVVNPSTLRMLLHCYKAKLNSNAHTSANHAPKKRIWQQNYTNLKHMEMVLNVFTSDGGAWCTRTDITNSASNFTGYWHRAIAARHHWDFEMTGIYHFKLDYSETSLRHI